MAAIQRRCKLGRRALPFCHPSRPYCEWPFAQLQAECKRRGIPIIRKGPRNNTSKNGFVCALQQNDAAAASAGGQLARGDDLGAAARDPAVILRTHTNGGDRAGDGDRDAVDTAGHDALDDADDNESVDFAGESLMSELDELPVDKECEPNEPQHREVNAKYSATFRLVNVLFSSYASRFSEIMSGSGSDGVLDSPAQDRIWSDVEESFSSSTPAFSRLINDHEMFAGIDPSLRQQQRTHTTKRELVGMWKSLSVTYSLALQHAWQIQADDAQFYQVCGGRLDVLYLHLWLLLKPQLATHFAPQAAEHTSADSAEFSTATAAKEATNQLHYDTEQEPSSSQAKRARKRKRVQKSTSLPSVQTSKTQPDSNLHAEYMTLKLQVLREKQAVLATSTAQEQMRFIEERRRGLLRDVRDLSTTIADLQQRILQSTRTNATSTSSSSNRRDPATDDAIVVRELEQDVAFFRWQKQQRMADVTQCEQQIQQQLATLNGGNESCLHT